MEITLAGQDIRPKNHRHQTIFGLSEEFKRYCQLDNQGILESQKRV